MSESEKVITFLDINGNVMTIHDLPPIGYHGRWGPRQKHLIVAAVASGAITLEEVYIRYYLSADEFVGWKKAFDKSGVNGLKVKNCQKNRTTRSSQKQDDYIY